MGEFVGLLRVGWRVGACFVVSVGIGWCRLAPAHRVLCVDRTGMSIVHLCGVMRHCIYHIQI